MNRNFKKIIPAILSILVSLILSLVILLVFEFTLKKLFPKKLGKEFFKGNSLGKEAPNLGYTLQPNTILKEFGPEFSYKIAINKYGLRNQTTNHIPDQNADFRILLIGDSFTFGVGVDYENVWGTLLEKKLNEIHIKQKVEVINAGIPGYSTENEVGYLEKYFSNFQPDFVLLTFVTHDLTLLSLAESKIETKTKTKSNVQNLLISVRNSHLFQLALRMYRQNERLMSSKILNGPTGEFLKKN